MVISQAIALRTGSVWKGLSDEELLRLCMGNKELKIERDENGTIFIISPTKFGISHKNSGLLIELGIWNKIVKKGVLTDSYGGYILPDTSMRAPDIGFVLIEKYRTLTAKDKDSFAPICPDFVNEIISSKGELQEARKKMTMWIRNGCQVAWLIDPFVKKIYSFENNWTEYVHDDFNKDLQVPNFYPISLFCPQKCL